MKRYLLAHTSALSTQVIKYSMLSMLLMCGVLGKVRAEEEVIPNWQEDTLTGDWGGLRTKLYKQGVNLGLTHKSDVLTNVSGGLKRGTSWLGYTEARAEFDLDKLWGWSDFSANFVYISNLGSRFNSKYIGAFSGVDNIEVSTNTGTFYQAWLQKSFIDNQVLILAGIYAIDTEFYVTDTSGTFIQPPNGMANEVAQAGVNGPAIFPLGALAIRLKLTSADEKFYGQVALTDGVPGDPNNPRGTHIKLADGDGTFAIAEFGYMPRVKESANAEQSDLFVFDKTAIGFWRYSGRFDAIDGGDSRHINQGAYVVAERTLYLESGHPNQGLAGFMRLGFANKNVNVLDWSSSFGVHYHGLIDGRDDDIAGLAVTLNHAGKPYRSANSSEHYEVNVEATYRAQITPYFAVQPTLQYLSNPSMDSSIENAWVIGARFELEF